MSAAVLALIALAAVAWCAAMLRPVAVAARMFQIEEYERARFLRWGATAPWMLHRSALAGAAVGAAGLVAAALVPTAIASDVAATAWLAGAGVAAMLWRWISPKKQLVLTSRMRRILALTGALVAVLAGACGLAMARSAIAGAIVAMLLLALAPLLAQCLLVVADVLLVPVELAVRRGYLRRAARRIDAVHPLVVAIAGSYGKTSTKHILAALLAPSVPTLPTRKSFNTLMGITRVINEDLQDSHRLFVVEMDAYAAGEIASMCRLVHPAVAVVTAVGPQHLERFGSVDAIGDALYEVIAALPADGTAFVAAESPDALRLAERARSEGRAAVTYGVAREGDMAAGISVCAREITVDAKGARFTWEWRERQVSREVLIPLLGRHQVMNVTAALGVVAHLGYDLDAAVRVAATLPHIEHRLQPVGTGPLTVIDDSYNANPVGVHNGLEVLQMMQGGRKILVTPGLVELGPVQDEENRRYGKHAAHVCDDVIVMEARPSAALLEGLREGGIAESAIHVVRSLDDATRVIAQVGRPGDVVLFANDLPDTYLGGG